VSFSKNNDEEYSRFNNINVAVASSITSYARIKMSDIKTKYINNIYYSDTDSLDLDIELPDKYISNNLGDFKLEAKFKNIIYIAPKSYAANLIKDCPFEKNKELIVIKGFKNNNVEYNDVANMVNEGNILKLKHEK